MGKSGGAQVWPRQGDRKRREAGGSEQSSGLAAGQGACSRGGGVCQSAHGTIGLHFCFSS